MPKIQDLGPALVDALRKRAVDKGGDVHRLLEDFSESSISGGRVLVSDGDGEVRLLVPIADGFEGPDSVSVVPLDNKSRVLEQANRVGDVEVEGVRFAEFILSPLAYKKELGDGDRPLIGLRGNGSDEDWGPLGFDDWFLEDFRLMASLAVKGGMEVRPDVELDANDPTWKALGEDQRAALEKLLGRKLPAVVHESVINEALEISRRGDDEVQTGALESLALAVTPDAPATMVSDSYPALARAQGVLQKALGEDWADPSEISKSLANLATPHSSKPDALSSRARASNPEAAIDALASAFGYEFAQTRQPSLGLIDALIDDSEGKLSYPDVIALRQLREEIDYAEQAALFGEDMVIAPSSTSDADAKVAEVYEFLSKDLGLDESRVFRLANQITAALNVPSDQPAVIVLSGKGGTGVDTLFERVLELTEEEPIEVQGAGELRGGDPVGYLTGSPEDLPGIARGAWAKFRKPDQRFVTALRGVESVGEGTTDADEAKAAKKALWNFISDVQRDGQFQGYDPADIDKESGAAVKLGGGVVLVRTNQDVAELENSMSPKAWSRISSRVVDFSKISKDSAIAQLRASLAATVEKEYGMNEVEVEIDSSMENFLTSCLQSGLSAAQMHDMARSQLLPRVHFANTQGTLGAKIRLEMVRGLTPKETRELREAWSKGQLFSISGNGDCPFTVFDAGRYNADAKTAVSAQVTAASTESAKVEGLLRTIAELQLRGGKSEATIDELVAENRQIFARSDAAETRIDALGWINERLGWELQDMKEFRKAALTTIDALEKDVAKANRRITKLNKDIKTAKTAGKKMEGDLREAIKERDDIQKTLRAVEAEFEEAIQGLGQEKGKGSAADTFEQILQMSKEPAASNRYYRVMLETMLNIGAGRAIEEARALGQYTDKFGQIAKTGGLYVAASQALGLRANLQVLNGMEQMARLSGYGWNRQLSNEWKTLVGEASQFKGRDPTVAGTVLKNLFGRLGIGV